jgi:splicing factor 3B subunit 3
MHLYHLTLQAATASIGAIVGNFSGVRQQEIIVARGNSLELLRIDAQTGKISIALASDAFGSLRSLAAFRLTGGTKGQLRALSLRSLTNPFVDYIIVGSDSGRIVILEYDPKTNSFVKLHQETFGKSGARRIVPGQFLATDPKGRSVMISAVEKSKLVYVLNRDAAANLTISSPLEAHKANAIIHHIVGLDVGFENPLYAALEVDYTESDQDPTGEAFNSTEKVGCTLLHQRNLLNMKLDVDILRTGSRTQPRCPKVERTYRSSCQLLGASTRRPISELGKVRRSFRGACVL